MKVTVESTAELVAVDGVPCRAWAGTAEDGTEVLLMVYRVAVAVGDGQQQAARDLVEAPPVELRPLRLVFGEDGR